MMKEIDKQLPLILSGEVVHGKGLGKTVGMPTANLRIQNEKLPATGVYATKVRIGEETYCSVTNIGRRPSVDEEKHITVESFIFDFDKDIYGQTVTLEVCKYLRPVQKFHNLKEVHEQVEKDIEQTKKYFE